MYVIFFVCGCSHVSFQPPITHLGNRMRHLRNFRLDFWTFLPTYGSHKWMTVKPKIFLFTNESFRKFWTRFFWSNSSNKQKQFLDLRQRVIADFS